MGALALELLQRLASGRAACRARCAVRPPPTHRPGDPQRWRRRRLPGIRVARRPRRRSPRSRRSSSAAEPSSVHPALAAHGGSARCRRRPLCPTLPYAAGRHRAGAAGGSAAAAADDDESSFVAPLLPSHMMSLLRDHEPQRFVDALAADVASADRWGAPERARLFAGTLRQLRPFLAAVAAARFRRRRLRRRRARRRAVRVRIGAAQTDHVPAARRRDHRRRHLRALPGPRRRLLGAEGCGRPRPSAHRRARAHVTPCRWKWTSKMTRRRRRRRRWRHCCSTHSGSSLPLTRSCPRAAATRRRIPNHPSRAQRPGRGRRERGAPRARPPARRRRRRRRRRRAGVDAAGGCGTVGGDLGRRG